MSPKLLPGVLLALLLGACSKEGGEAAKDPDWQRGRAVYVANCVACHNNDPSKDGPIGPANKG
jgi:mono/diheme cytochrome c family protein